MEAHSTTYLSPAQLAARWHKAVGSLANDRSAKRGVTYVKIRGKILYPLAEVERFESMSLVEVSA